MTYQQFKANLLAELGGHFPPDTAITVHTIPRNNQSFAEGLTILESGFNISPTIYIGEYYEDLKKGLAFSDVFSNILDAYYNYRPHENIDPAFFKDFHNICHRVAFKLVHYERNRELLKEIPHIPFLDLAVVFYCLVTSTSHANATILITKEHCKLWDTCTDKLYALARENTPRLMDSHLEQTAFSVLSPTPMYILSNKSRYFGAACLLYDRLLSKLSHNLSVDFFIIPSSIHEVLLVPASSNMCKEDFNRMIQEVNNSSLRPEEILSDHVYYYSNSDDKILM